MMSARNIGEALEQHGEETASPGGKVDRTNIKQEVVEVSMGTPCSRYNSMTIRTTINHRRREDKGEAQSTFERYTRVRRGRQ